MLKQLPRYLFFLCIVKPVVWVMLGVRVRNRPNLPTSSAIIAANHNSHLDTVVLMALFPLRQLRQVRPAAAADYWLKNRWIAWFAKNIIGIVPVYRQGEDSDQDPLQHCYEALEDGNILIYFPEGSRGEPEKMSEFKYGIAKIAQRFPQTPVVPVFMQGMGKALPKGSALLLPAQCEVAIGTPLHYRHSSPQTFLQKLRSRIESMSRQRPSLVGLEN